MEYLYFLAVFYFIPSLIAGFRNHRSAGSIFVINLFLGWTFLGWVIALAMSVSGGGDKT